MSIQKTIVCNVGQKKFRFKIEIDELNEPIQEVLPQHPTKFEKIISVLRRLHKKWNRPIRKSELMRYTHLSLEEIDLIVGEIEELGLISLKAVLNSNKKLTHWIYPLKL